MPMTKETDERIADAIKQASEVAAQDIPHRGLLLDLTRLLAQQQLVAKQQREQHEITTQRLIEQHVLLREIRQTKLDALPEPLAKRIENVAPSNIAPFIRRPKLWAVHNQATGEIHAMVDRQSADLFASVHNQVNEYDDVIGPPVVVIPSPWLEVDHWKTIAEQEAGWVSDCNDMLTAALQQNDELETQLDRLRRGTDTPIRPIRAAALFTDRNTGGRFVRLGVATGAGSKSGRRAVIYRCARSSELHYRDPQDFERNMLPVTGE